MNPPLRGLKVLDFTTLLPGPYATLMLADLGAEVLCITAPGRHDVTARMPPFLPDGTSAATAWLYRNKRRITLNLKHPRGREVVLRLLQSHDVLIEQFRPGVMERLGLGYRQLGRRFPGLIYCSLTGYGQDGPLAARAGHDIDYLSRAGLMSHSGRAETGPSLSGMQIADVAAGAQGAVIAVLAAVIHRSRTGEGQHLDVAMTDGVVPFNALAAACLLAGGPEPTYESTLLNGGSLYDFYQTADGRWLAFGGLEPQFFHAFCRAIGRPQWAEEGVQPPDLAERKAELRRIMASRTLAQWQEAFAGLDACVEPVESLGEALEGELARARGWVVEVPAAGGGYTVRQPAHPLKFSRTPPRYRHAGPPPDAHNRRVMAELGYSQEETEALAAEGLFG